MATDGGSGTSCYSFPLNLRHEEYDDDGGEEYVDDGSEENDDDVDEEYDDDGSEKYADDGSNVEDDIEFDKCIDENVEFGGVVRNNEETEQRRVETILGENVDLSGDREVLESDEEVQGDVWQAGRPRGQDNAPVLWIERTFTTKKDFKGAVLEYGIRNGKELKYIKNDKVRVVAICTHECCNWKITLRRVPDEVCWRVLSFNDNHEGCTWSEKNRLLTSLKVANKWKKELKDNSKMTMHEFRKKIWTSGHYSLSSRQAYKAMTFAKRDIKGEAEDNFKKIWSYDAEIRKTNPMSRFFIKLSDDGGMERLKRVYVCWEACREGFKYCRPLIGVDGCHLKGRVGMLLTAISIDGNEGIFSLAYAFVEGENKDSWCWFLKLLQRDLETIEINENNLTFMSDKQRGLIPAFHEVFPRASHRFCVRHLHGNMRVVGFIGQPIKDALWKAARATTVNTFTTAFRELKDLDVKAFEWLADKHPAEWSRSHFNTRAQSDMLVNNICESFNSMILDARENPLITCLEILRKQLMVRIYECKTRASKWPGPICPNIVKKLDIVEQQAGSFWCYQSSETLFEVIGPVDQHQVDLGRHSCSSRKWELTGIPCRHAVYAIWKKYGKGPVYDYVHPCYSVQTYKKTYEGCIHPIAGPDEWPIIQREPPLPVCHHYTKHKLEGLRIDIEITNGCENETDVNEVDPLLEEVNDFTNLDDTLLDEVDGTDVNGAEVNDFTNLGNNSFEVVKIKCYNPLLDEWDAIQIPWEVFDNTQEPPCDGTEPEEATSEGYARGPPKAMLKKGRKQKKALGSTRKYKTRSTSMFKSKFHGNSKEPIEIE
ncbi:PREDICTED: uncharacterized protein LOC109160617 [Ipomoea nil]|uniref:uncharacterized protein LOC109160617 n=1 Tax=Ipomoea nil TaxID=35883 RepID=UPI00090176A6|nr:PREDICTED: uncharacterized protein LOC109160617 [Ipomoea nil]